MCRRGGEGEGALWFPVLWVILPHPAPVVPCVVVPCAPAPPVGQGARPSLGGSYADCLLEREAWLGGGGGGGLRRGDAAPYTLSGRILIIGRIDLEEQATLRQPRVRMIFSTGGTVCTNGYTLISKP